CGRSRCRAGGPSLAARAGCALGAPTPRTSRPAAAVLSRHGCRATDAAPRPRGAAALAALAGAGTSVRPRPGHGHRQGEREGRMSFVIWGMGTAVPPSAVSQQQALRIAEQICGRSGEAGEVLSALYRHTAIEQRYLAFDREVLDDVLQGTRHTG